MKNHTAQPAVQAHLSFDPWPYIWFCLASFFMAVLFVALTPAHANAGDATEIVAADDVQHCLRPRMDNRVADICSYDGRHLAGRTIPSLDESPTNSATFVDSMIWGTDLGLNVHIGDATLYFFGDTIPKAQIDNGNLQVAGALLGTPFAYDYDGDAALDWVDASVTEEGVLRYNTVTELAAFDADGNPTGLLNETEREFFFNGNDPSGVEAGFFAPSGLAQVDDETLYYWYGKYIQNTSCDQSHLLAMDANTGEWRYLSFFADQKFIQVAPVEVSRRDMPPVEGACELPWASDDERGFLLYGSGVAGDDNVPFDEASPLGQCMALTGAGYRNSYLYLAYVRLEDLEEPDLSARVYYYTGREDGCWVAGDVQAAAPISDQQSFGELSIVRLPGTDYLLMANSNGSFNLRIADLSRPWVWSEPVRAYPKGYGDHFIDGSVRLVERVVTDEDTLLAENAIVFDRVTSTWKGTLIDPLMQKYGVAVYSAFVELDTLLAGLE